MYTDQLPVFWICVHHVDHSVHLQLPKNGGWVGERHARRLPLPQSAHLGSRQLPDDLHLPVQPCCAQWRPPPVFPHNNSLCLQVLGHNADPRSRMFSAIWMAAPAVASIAWTVLEAARWACLVRCCVLCCGDEGEDRACCALLQGALLALNRLVVAGQFTPAPSILRPCCLLHGACALPCPPPCRQPPAALRGSSCSTR